MAQKKEEIKPLMEIEKEIEEIIKELEVYPNVKEPLKELKRKFKSAQHALDDRDYWSAFFDVLSIGRILKDIYHRVPLEKMPRVVVDLHGELAEKFKEKLKEVVEKSERQKEEFGKVLGE